MRQRSLGDRLANSWAGMLTKRLTSWIQFQIISYYKKFDRETLELLREIWKEERGTVLFSPQELYMIYSVARAQRDRGGDFAEVGVFRGASAKIIAEALQGEANLYLFDTFEGLPHASEVDPRFEVGMFKADEGAVRERLSSYKRVHLIKGLFPDSAQPIDDNLFSLVHLDVDTYESTLASLRYFADRMLPNSIILSHDYSQCEGVKRAVDEFVAERGREFRLVELDVSQVMLLKG